MDFLTAYLAGVVALIGLWAWRVPHEDVRMVFILAIAFPLTIVGIVVISTMNATGWDLDIVDVSGVKMFGYRKPTNPLAKGFAVTVFGKEIQVYSVRKNG